MLKKKLKRKPKEPVEIEVLKPQYTDLRQVMDYTRGLSIFYSGAEGGEMMNWLYDLGIRNFLFSYEYIQGKGSKLLRQYDDVHIFVDSGAYTYMHDGKFSNYTVEQWEEQIEKYLKWAEKHKDNIFAICDLDLQYLVGEETVYRWRKEYFEPFMLRTGIPVCFMYHEEGAEQWEYMCKRYPYIGMSLAIDKKENGRAEIHDMLRTAEKYNTLVQGMASTNTKLLAELPYYTVDSTTYQSGVKFAEISIWNGMKMTRVKKEDFETKAFPFIEQFDVDIDFDKLLNCDRREMIRVNAYAFIQAEKYVNERLKSRMYWLKAKTDKQDISSLPADFFPDADWFDGNCTEYKDYATKMNINPDCEDATPLIYFTTTFLNWDNPEYLSCREEMLEAEGKIEEIHDMFINRIVPDTDTKIKDLVEFFTETVEGKNDKLLQLGTNFDRIVKERDTYIEEEEFENVDVPKEEVEIYLDGKLKLLTVDSAAPDIDALDKEIFAENAVEVVRDEKGRVLKGVSIRKKSKKVYSDKFPKYACDTCFSAQKCPEFKAGFVCAYNKMFDRFDSRNMSDIIEGMQGMLNHNMVRMQKAMMTEIMNGGLPDESVTKFIDQNVRLMQQMKQMYDQAGSEVLRQTNVIRADGTRESTTMVQNPQGGGILEKLFGMDAPPRKDEDVEDVDIIEEAEVVED